jgi:intergrase/recombinase
VGPPGFEPDCREIRADFLKWLESKNYNEEYAKRIVIELDRRVDLISIPLDVAMVFRGLTHGQQHNLNRAVRAFFNFYEEAVGVDERYLKAFRKAIPRDVVGVDLRMASETEIMSSLRRLSEAPLKYQGFYNLLLDSGLRITEAVRLINDFKDVEEVGGFYRCSLGYFRGSKRACFAYFTHETLRLIKTVDCKIFARTAGHYFSKRGYVPSKYLRKYAFDKMIQLEIPESIADFIQGRVPQRIGAKHYMALARQAEKVKQETQSFTYEGQEKWWSHETEKSEIHRYYPNSWWDNVVF